MVGTGSGLGPLQQLGYVAVPIHRDERVLDLTIDDDAVEGGAAAGKGVSQRNWSRSFSRPEPRAWRRSDRAMPRSATSCFIERTGWPPNP